MAAAYLKGEPVEGEIAVITRAQAAEADYNLSPSRWVGPLGSDDETDLKSIIDRFDALNSEEVEISRNISVALQTLRGVV
jgi:type I restriction enzyme M protein